MMNLRAQIRHADREREETAKWPTETEAAAILGASVKTIQRYAEKGMIEMQKRPRAGRKPENVCNPRDIDDLRPKTHIMPEAAAPEPQTALAIAARPAPMPVQAEVGALIQTIATAFAAARPDVQIAKNLSEKLVLTLKEASGCGLSVKFLRSAVDSGSLRCFRDGRRIKIPRAALDEFVRNGGELRCTATLKLEFDFADQEAISRFARLLRELIPEEERAQFLEDWRAAAMNAGFPAFAK